MNAKSRADSQPGAADGGLSHSPMRSEQIIYSLIRDRVPGAGEWLGWGVGLLSPLPLPRAPPRPPPPPPSHPSPTPGSRRAHTFPDN